MADHIASSQKCAVTDTKPPGGNKPDAFARLAEAAASAQAYLNNPKAEKTSTRREPVRLVPDLNELPRPSDQKHGSASSASRATSHRPRAPRVSTVRQAKNYLRATASPQFLRSTPNLQRHGRKCAICRHPEREMIEELFIHWHSPQAIANFLSDYEEINWVSIYRHAYALGLDQVRRRNLRHFFENLLDDAINATPTFAGVLGAARALGCVTEDGRWVEPEKRILMTTLVRHEEPASTTISTEPNSSAASTDTAPPRQEEGLRVRAAHVGADYDRPEFDRPKFPRQRPTARSGTREIRLPLNSHKTKHKPISNR